MQHFFEQAIAVTNFDENEIRDARNKFQTAIRKGLMIKRKALGIDGFGLIHVRVIGQGGQGARLGDGIDVDPVLDQEIGYGEFAHKLVELGGGQRLRVDQADTGSTAGKGSVDRPLFEGEQLAGEVPRDLFARPLGPLEFGWEDARAVFRHDGGGCRMAFGQLLKQRIAAQPHGDIGAAAVAAQAARQATRGAAMLLHGHANIALALAQHIERDMGPANSWQVVAAPGGGLLLTARTAPALWSAAVPDLRSRLNALPVALLGEPDDTVLQALLERFFRERNIRPSDDLLPYLAHRIERSVAKAREIVAKLDETADAQHRPITKALERQILDFDAADEDAPE